MAKVILISQFSIPYQKIGSWTTMYKNYLSNNHLVDYIICETPETHIPEVTYKTIDASISSKIKKRITKKPYANYLKALSEIIIDGEDYIIQLVDNFGLAKALKDFLDASNYKNRFYIQFFYHGYPPFFGNFESRWFFEFIDEMIVLTHDSYIAHKETYTILPCLFSVLHNGIDTSKFYKLEASEKKALKTKHKVDGKTIFTWCSKDRPKKGLGLILNAWKRIYNNELNIELWIIGAKRDQDIEGVKFLGLVPNGELPEYYQISDCYLFPTLTHEGFGLSLIEALHCGNYCIASNLGGVAEVLQNGKYGKLIDNPHFIEDWVNAIQDFLNNRYKKEQLPAGLYSSNQWNKGMNAIINNAKISIDIN
ncbi:glycosyltransferase family 4 protein [Flavivirga eckloniae]|uniref:Glycosyl transferase family 1 n=1 Tax=Flavivirga eckloniae TaxID=1803846 RepID=A0A2K9PMB7_9FLAO|nr:glycosyltransferase family 4 protein [Flavivirga eckloniae]AUP78175.1 glycosyl transferase family 1 [Flavivirga eckloniae]